MLLQPVVIPAGHISTFCHGKEARQMYKVLQGQHTHARTHTYILFYFLNQKIKPIYMQVSGAECENSHSETHCGRMQG